MQVSKNGSLELFLKVCDMNNLIYYCYLCILVNYVSYCTDLRISLSESVVLREVHKDAKDLFNVCSDLRRVCWTLWSPTQSLGTDVSSLQVNIICKHFKIMYLILILFMSLMIGNHCETVHGIPAHAFSSKR